MVVKPKLMKLSHTRVPQKCSGNDLARCESTAVPWRARRHPCRVQVITNDCYSWWHLNRLGLAAATRV